MTPVAPDPIGQPGALTVEQAARWLGISPRQCYRLVSAGRIPARKLGSRRGLRISRAWLESFLAVGDPPGQLAS